MIERFEEQLHHDLHQFLLSMKETDARLPECPDVEEKWEQIAKAYIPKSLYSRWHQGVQRLSIRFPRLDDVYWHGRR